METPMLKALSLIGAVAIAAALLLPTVSVARTVEDQNQNDSTKVSYADLNLASQSGVDQLLVRIHGTARQVCGISAPTSLSEIQYNRNCYAGAVASAQPGFDQAVAGARHGEVIVGGASLIVSAPRQ
jgi:UrcA family protein